MSPRYSLPAEDLDIVYKSVESFWPENKVFLITGGTGFFGRWLVEIICYIEHKKMSNNRFIVFTRQNPNDVCSKINILNESFFQIRQQDLAETFSIEESVDYVFHGASDVTAVKDGAKHSFKSSLQTTENIFAALKMMNYKKFLFVSSGGLYQNGENADESSNLVQTNGDNSYPTQKKLSEEVVLKYPRTCVARCFSFVGPFANLKMAAMDMLLKKTQGHDIQVQSPDVVRSFMYPTDLVVALLKLLLLENKNKIYNIGSKDFIALKNLAEKIQLLDEQKNNIKINLQNETQALAGKIYYPNTQRFDSEFGSGLTVGLDEALKKTFNFIKGQKMETL